MDTIGIAPLDSEGVPLQVWLQIKDLNKEMKLQLIALLSNSLLSNKDLQEPAPFWTKGFAGKWIDDKSTDEIISEIRSARTTNTIDIML